MMTTTSPRLPAQRLPAGPTLLSVHALTKKYGDRVVLDGFDLDVRSGEVVTLLGANGDRKSVV